MESCQRIKWNFKSTTPTCLVDQRFQIVQPFPEGRQCKFTGEQSLAQFRQESFLLDQLVQILVSCENPAQMKGVASIVH